MMITITRDELFQYAINGMALAGAVAEGESFQPRCAFSIKGDALKKLTPEEIDSLEVAVKEVVFEHIEEESP